MRGMLNFCFKKDLFKKPSENYLENKKYEFVLLIPVYSQGGFRTAAK